ncbi:MAG: hypothetical protein G01um10147_477 [Microgenomates group bacterium Gr01-1014_7]|nr:MAG: hypothetical protein G01um10147_477 [Microgenomates group bacterium Gr01-1014_7]
MTQVETDSQNPEDLRIVLVDKNGQPLEVSPSTKDGASDIFDGLRRVLVASVGNELFIVNPFITEQAEQSSEPKEDKPKIELPKYYPEIPETDELERQRVEATERLAVPLGIDRNQFLAKLPGRFPERNRDNERYALNIPLISLDLTPFGISWYDATSAALFYDPDNPEVTLKPYIYEGLRNVETWKDPRRGVRPFPQVPHSVWMQDGSRYKGMEPRDVRSSLERVERGADHWKGMSETLLRPDKIKAMPWDVIGGHLKLSELEPGGVPYVRWRAGPRFDAHSDGSALPEFRALVCGSEYIVA